MSAGAKRYVVQYTDPGSQTVAVGPFTSERRAYDAAYLLRAVPGMGRVEVLELLRVRDVAAFYKDAWS